MANKYEKISIEPQTTVLLFVEGPDEIAFFELLLKKMKLDHIQVIPYHGKHRLLDKQQGGFILQVQTLQNEIEAFEKIQTICIVVDIDQGQNNVDRAKGAFKQLGFGMPKTARSIYKQTSPFTAILTLPPNQEGTGQMLEDLLWAYFQEAQEPTIPCVDEFIDCLKASVNLKTNLEPKTRYYALLAAKHDPIAIEDNDELSGDAMYKSLVRHIANWDSPVFNDLKAFLTQLAT